MDQSLKARLMRLCTDVDSAYSLTVRDLLMVDDWQAILALEVKPSSYTEAEAYKADAAIEALFCKNASIDFGVDREAVARSKFFEAEHRCYATNARFTNYNTGYYPDCDWRIVQFLDRVTKRVARILGRPPLSIRGKFGPGTTYEMQQLLGEASKSFTVADKAYAKSLTADANYLVEHPDVADRYVSSFWPGQSEQRVTVRGNRLFCVPKNAKTDRTIGISPGVNVYLQLGIAEKFTAPLLRCGIDLSSQQHRHRVLAKDALRLGLATLDESMASDLWSREAVRFLLRDSGLWYDFLDTLREKFTEVDGKWVRLEKFSAMGNGFTFPLQTVLFYAITREVCGDECIVSVFGDDIICPAAKAPDVMAALRFFGHKVNEDKSYHTGPFRESCGEDFFNGVPTRPHFLKVWPSTPQDWIKLHNGLVRRSSSRAHLAFAKWCKRQIPLPYRLGGPEELGDAVLHGHPWRIRVRNGMRQVRGVSNVGREVNTKHLDDRAVLTALLSGATLRYEFSHELNNPKRRTRGSFLACRGSSGFKVKWFGIS